MGVEGPPLRSNVTARIWAVSDLQTANTAEARRCLSTAIDDIQHLELDLDAIWYLGDAIMGFDVPTNRGIAEVQVELFEEMGLPLRYVMGNHDLDYAKRSGDLDSPFYDAVQEIEGWRTTSSPNDFAFTEHLGDWLVLFLSDHIDENGAWSVTHGRVQGDESAYPYTAEDYRSWLARVTEGERYVVIAGHNAFPGGNRAGEIQRWFFPLPASVRLHLYGHAHVGDEKHVGVEADRTISYVDGHPIPQVNVASLEDDRGDTIRSVVLDLDDEGGVGVWFRDHSSRTWLESYRHSGIEPETT